jgi:octanoyl-[GcvH]:protein N-octanoyltransferase
MSFFLTELVKKYQLTATIGEISGSYCPGDYDLSVSGKKFAGIAQRRRQSGVAVQAYLAVTGSGSSRAQIVRAFYDRAQAENQITYPIVIPSMMASLSELCGRAIHVETVMLDAITLLMDLSRSIEYSDLSEAERNEMVNRLQFLKRHNPFNN